MNLVSGGVGYTLLPGRVRGFFGDKVQFIPLRSQYLMRQTIGLSFVRARERDPNLLGAHGRLPSKCKTCRLAFRRHRRCVVSKHPPVSQLALFLPVRTYLQSAIAHGDPPVKIAAVSLVTTLVGGIRIEQPIIVGSIDAVRRIAVKDR